MATTQFERGTDANGGATTLPLAISADSHVIEPVEAALSRVVSLQGRLQAGGRTCLT